MRVRLGHLPPPAGPPRGTVVVLPGRAEFIEKYGETLASCRRLGLRGRHPRLARPGRLGPLPRRIAHRGHVVQVEDYLADLAAVMARLEQLRLPRPFLMLSHSMGGHIGLRYLHAHPDRFAGSVMSAPMFGIRLTPTPEPVARALCAAAIAARRRHALRAGPARLRRSPRYVFARNRLTSSPERYAESAPPRGRHARAGAGRRHLWLARRRPALDRADPAAGLSGGDLDPDPGLPGRRRADRQQPRAGRDRAAPARTAGCSRFPARGTSCCSSATRSATRCSRRSATFADEVTR